LDWCKFSLVGIVSTLLLECSITSWELTSTPCRISRDHDTLDLHVALASLLSQSQNLEILHTTPFGTKSCTRLGSCWVVSKITLFEFTIVWAWSLSSCGNDVVSTVAGLASRNRFIQPTTLQICKRDRLLAIKWHSPLNLVLIE
jgi:hypothetical protein